MNQTLNVDQLNSALNSLRTLRSSVSHVFESLSNGLRADHGEDGKDKFLLELQELLNNVNINLRDLDQTVNGLPVPTTLTLNLGNTTYLSQETTQERQTYYTQLVNSYKWTDKVHEYSSFAHTLLSQNSLKRSYINSGNTKRRGKLQSNHNVAPVQVDQVINNIDRSYNDMKITISRPFASNAVVQINLSHVLKAVVAFKGLLMEWVMVKGYGETLDLWTESRHHVFRKVTENAHAAMLHFYSPTLPDLAVRSFMTWLHSYVNLFSEPCKRCSCHLHHTSLLPPAWRDFRTLEPFHDECKQ
ncbi:mediator of RNA polymerase II transcription subunit 27 [Cydia splendana]|uniref:mediator of RNA polymerase II transcription subunit 27 n=1 Tax=Cydia splendana TaxID=1100963 RepID=UPI00213ACAEE